MKHLQLVSLTVCALFFVSCESTGTAGKGNQEVKRMAAIEQEQKENSEVDESDRNLWNAQHDILKRDGNAVSRYY